MGDLRKRLAEALLDMAPDAPDPAVRATVAHVLGGGGPAVVRAAEEQEALGDQMLRQLDLLRVAAGRPDLLLPDLMRPTAEGMPALLLILQAAIDRWRVVEPTAFPNPMASDRFGEVTLQGAPEGVEPPEAFVAMLMAAACQDCNPNLLLVYVGEARIHVESGRSTADVIPDQMGNVWRPIIAHDETCPTLARIERERGDTDG